MSIYLQHAAMREPARMKRIGVIGATLSFFDHKDPGTGSAKFLGGDLIELCDDIMAPIHCAYVNQCGSLWITARATTCGALQETVEDVLRRGTTVEWAGYQYRVTPLSIGGRSGAQLCGITVRRLVDGEEKGNPMCVYDLRLGDGWGIPRDICAVQLATSICLASYALNMQLRFSPSYTGLMVLREELQRWGEIPTLSSEWQTAIRAVMAHPFAWSRPLTPTERDQETVLIAKFDRNGSYVSSAREVPLGDPTLTYRFHPGMPGVYLLDASAPATYPADVPGLFYSERGLDHYPHQVEQVWAWEPQIRLALKHGWQITIHQGYSWLGKHDLFRSWQERIWAARRICAAHPDAVIARCAEGMIKQIGVTAIGRLRQTRGHQMTSAAEAEAAGQAVQWYERDDQGGLTGMVAVETDTGRDDLYQPAWWSTFVANAVERLQSAILAHAAMGAAPFGAWVDAYYVLGLAAPEALIDPLKPGKFRLDSLITADPADIPAQAQPLVSWFANKKRAQKEVEHVAV